MRDQGLPHALEPVVRRAILLGAVSGMVLIAAPAWSGEDQPAADPDVVHVAPDQQREMRIQTATATDQEIVKPIDAAGAVAFDERMVTHLRARTSGRVLSLAVVPGDRVAGGQTLASLDASSVLDAKKGLDAAVANLAEAVTSRNLAVTGAERAASLLKIGGVARAEVEAKQVQLAKAQAAVQTAQAQVDLYRAQYERLAPGGRPGTSTIVSPIAGVVVGEHITLGEVVETTQDAFTVADPSRVVVNASLFGFDIDLVKAGDRATILAPIRPQEPFDARVGAVDAALDPVTNAGRARLQVDNPQDLLKANMFVSVRIAADLGRRGVTIPASAVQQSDQGSIAFVKTGHDTFVRRDLKLGLQRSDWVEVLDGVTTGETVATSGSFALKSILLRSLLGSTD